MKNINSTYIATIRVMLRESILDPQGKAVEHAIVGLGVTGVANVRMGKLIELRVEAANESEARAQIEVVCKKLLANPVMEDFSFELKKLQ